MADDLHTNRDDPAGYAVTFEYGDDGEAVALIVTRLADDKKVGRAKSRDEVDKLVKADRGKKRR